MKVLIVGKTHVGGEMCVGGITERRDAVRLYEADGAFPPANTPYNVGEWWEMTLVPKAPLIPPHIEDVFVTKRALVGNQAGLANYLRTIVVPWRGGVEALYDGKLGFTVSNNGYIQADLPSHSTGFWIPDEDLVHLAGGRRYRCGTREMSYVGVEAPIPSIPAGTLVRVSLARWWKQPNAAPDFPERCYLQLSGWYL